MRSLNILYLSTNFPFPADTGSRMRSLQILEQLAKVGRVTFVCPGQAEDLEGQKDHVNLLCKEVHFIDDQRFGPHSGSLRPPGIWQRLAHIFRLFPSWYLHDFVCQELRNKLEEIDLESYDLILLRYPQLAYYFLSDRRLRNLLDRIVIDVDDIAIQVQTRRVNQMAFGYEKLRHWLELQFLRHYFTKLRSVGACFIVSDKDRIYMERQCKTERLLLLPNTVHVNGRPTGSRLGDTRQEILFCGQLSFTHNEEALLYFCREVFPIIQRDIPNVQFTIVGKNPSEAVQGLDHENGIRVVGWVPSTRPYYERATIFVVPILNGAGTKIKLLEAMSHSTPVVTTTIGAEGIDVENGKHVLIADTAQSMAQKCMDLLHNAEERRQMAQAGYDFVRERYSNEQFIKHFDEFLVFMLSRLQANNNRAREALEHVLDGQKRGRRRDEQCLA